MITKGWNETSEKCMNYETSTTLVTRGLLGTLGNFGVDTAPYHQFDSYRNVPTRKIRKKK